MKIPELGIYKHFKGNVYELFAIGKNSENPDELLAIYRSKKSPDEIWVRPIYMWDEEVTLPNGEKCKRFEKM